ncbi:hypothetical protein KKF11_02080 [Patescibacteria group bacterium]|nr:hypothetical protein [Patescibacteria group bacterium]
MSWRTKAVRKVNRLAGEDFSSPFTQEAKERIEELLLKDSVLWGIYHVNDHNSGVFYDAAFEIKPKDSETIAEAITRYTALLKSEEDPPYYTARWKVFRVVFSHQPLWRRVWSNLW